MRILVVEDEIELAEAIADSEAFSIERLLLLEDGSISVHANPSPVFKSCIAKADLVESSARKCMSGIEVNGQVPVILTNLEY